MSNIGTAQNNWSQRIQAALDSLRRELGESDDELLRQVGLSDESPSSQSDSSQE